MKKNILIVGGTSGLGLELAKHYVSDGHTVCVTGVSEVDLPGALFQEFLVTSDTVQLGKDIDRVLDRFEPVNTLIYCAGLPEAHRREALDDDELAATVNLRVLAPMLFVRRLNARSETLLKVMLVTSDAQHAPRDHAPADGAVEAGLCGFGASLVRKSGVGKVLVTSSAVGLEPKWAADQVVELSSGPFKYKFAKILRDPQRVELVEMLDDQLTSIL